MSRFWVAAGVDLTHQIESKIELQGQMLQLNGSIRTILTWNLCERAFLESDGSRNQYRLLRGSGKFAEFVRKLGERFATSDLFALDQQQNESELTGSFRAGLISQYASEYELNATFCVRENKGPEDFLDERQGDRQADAKESLDEKSKSRFKAAWQAWPVKRFRISRYGFLQVILETPPGGFLTPDEFLEPIGCLHKTMKLIPTTLSPEEAEERRKKYWLGQPELEVTAQWEIVGRILAQIIKVVHSTHDPKDLLRFDLTYESGWREKQSFAAGVSLPLRTEYVVLSIREITLAGRRLHPEDLNKETRKQIARLAEEVPWVTPDQGKKQISPQRKKAISRILRADEATWNGEMCLLSSGTAVIVTLHPTTLKLPRGLDYPTYWLIVRRLVEYFVELRLLAWLVERQSADQFEYMMRELATTGRLVDYKNSAHSIAALSGLANRLRVAASADTIAQNDGILPKLQRLRTIFEIGRSLDYADRNLSAAQNLITSAESQQNENGILLLTAGLAGFTAILMGLALPPFLHYAADLKPQSHHNYVRILGFPAVDWVIFSWANFSVLLTSLALLTAARYVYKLFRIGDRLRARAKDDLQEDRQEILG